MITSSGENVEKLASLCTADGIVKWSNFYGKQYRGSSKNKKQNSNVIQQSEFWLHIQKKRKQGLEEIFTHSCL